MLLEDQARAKPKLGQSRKTASQAQAASPPIAGSSLFASRMHMTVAC